MTTEALDFPAVAGRINAAHDLAKRHADAALEHARTAGRLLTEVKETLSHGEWLPWLEANVAVSARQAQRYIRLAQGKALPERKPAALPEKLKCDTVSHLPEIGPGELFIATAEHGDWWDELVVMPYVDNAFAHYMHSSGPKDKNSGCDVVYTKKAVRLDYLDTFLEMLDFPWRYLVSVKRDFHPGFSRNLADDLSLGGGAA